MRKERKLELLYAFPALPNTFLQKMQGKGHANFAVFLTYGNELFVRCYHRYSKHSDKQIVERQRFVFAKDGCCRYGSDDGKTWSIMTEFREPVFCKSSYGYNFDNTYTVINMEAWEQSCLKYSCFDLYTGNCPMEYFRLYVKHPNIEYLMKSGYQFMIEDAYHGFYGGRISTKVDYGVNLKSNNLLKMLGLTKAEYKILKGKESLWHGYHLWREKFPNYPPEDIVMIADVFGYSCGTAEFVIRETGLKIRRIARYLSENGIETFDYSDYIRQCKEMRYNLLDTAISMPHDFMEVHTRLSRILKYGTSVKAQESFADHVDSRLELEFESEDLMIRQPASMDEIIEEGKNQSHCVAGYAERHAYGRLTILFIRRKDDPETAYYTMELANDGKIVQVRGFKNADMTDDVKQFVDKYKAYIKPIFANRKEKSA